MKTNLLGIFVALCLISFAQTQAFSGGVLPHLYTGIALTELTGELLQNYTYSFPLARAAFTAGEEVLIGTTLRDFGYLNQVSSPGSLAYVHIEVVNPRMSANKKVFQFNLTLVQAQANVLNYPLRVKHISLGYILVGELFEGQYDSSGIPSTFIYVKNSAMIAPATLGNTLVDFKTSASESPFLYDPAVYTGCGASKRNGNWIIETQNCTVITATLFITGLEMPVVNGANVLSLLTAATALDSTKDADIMKAVQFDLEDSTVSFFTADGTKDGLAMQFPVTAGVLYQVSMIAIGIV